MKCSLCTQDAIDELEFEGGNNAELSMIMRVCQAHWDEYEKDEFKFMDKHAEKIDLECYERLIDEADSLRNQDS